MEPESSLTTYHFLSSRINLRKCHDTANPLSKKVHTREYSLWWMRPYSNLSPFQYSKGLVLILVLRLTPDFHNKPAPRKTTTASHSNITTKKVLVNMVEIEYKWTPARLFLWERSLLLRSLCGRDFALICSFNATLVLSWIFCFTRQ